MQSSCFLTFFRVGWAIGMSIFILSRVRSIEHLESTRGADLNFIIKNSKHNDRLKDWEFIRIMTIKIMVCEILNVIGVILILFYQPNDYVKQKDFDVIGGVATEQNALERGQLILQ